VIPSSTSALKSLTGLGAHVVRSRNVATLLSALAVYDPFAPAGEIFADMTGAAAGTRVGTIYSADQLASDPPTGMLPVVHEDGEGRAAAGAGSGQGTGSGLGTAVAAHPAQFYRVFLEGRAKTQSTELRTLVEKLADRLLGAGGELLTVVHGPDCAPEV